MSFSLMPAKPVDGGCWGTYRARGPNAMEITNEGNGKRLVITNISHTIYQLSIGLQTCFSRQGRGNKEAFEFNHETLGSFSIRNPQGSSSVQILAVGPSLAHCLTEEAWRRTTPTPSRIGRTSQFSNRKYLL
jgi:hypothetical protein